MTLFGCHDRNRAIAGVAAAAERIKAKSFTIDFRPLALLDPIDRRAEHDRSAQAFQISIFSAISIASSISMPR